MDKNEAIKKLAENMIEPEAKVREYLSEDDLRLPLQLIHIRYCIELLNREKIYKPSSPVPEELAKAMKPFYVLLFYSDLNQKLGVEGQDPEKLREDLLVLAVKVAYEYGLTHGLGRT